METTDTNPQIAGKRFRPFDLADILQRWIVPLLVVAAICAAGAFVAASHLSKPVFTAEGQILLEQETEGTLLSGTKRQFWDVRDEAATRVEDVKNLRVITNVLETVPRDEWPRFLLQAENTEEAAITLAKKLDVSHLKPSQLVRVRLESDKPRGLDTTVNAVMHGLVEYLEAKKESDIEKRLQYLEEEASSIRKDIEVVQAKKEELAQKHSIHNFDREMVNPHYDLLVFTQEQYQTALDSALRLRAELEQVNQSFLRKSENLKASSPGMIQLEAERSKVEGAYKASELLVMDLRAELESVRALFADSAEVLRQGIVLSEDIEHLRGRLNRVEDRIRDLQLEAKVPVHVSVREEAVKPQEPTGSNFGKLFLVLAGAPWMLAVCGVLIFEGGYSKLRSRKELGEALGAKPAESIPVFTGNRGKSILCVRDFPDNLCSVALRKLAFKLHQDQARHEAKVFYFTGASRKSGVSWIASNVGEAMTQYCSKVLTLHLESDSGELPEPSTVEEGEAVIDAVLERLQRHESQRCQLDLSTESELVHNRELLARFIERVKEIYGVILIDGAPLGDSDMSLFLASLSDAAVLVAARNQSSYGEVRSSLEDLAAAKVPAVTAVLNFGGPWDPWSFLRGRFENVPKLFSSRPRKVASAS